MQRRQIELPDYGNHSRADTFRDLADLDRLCAPRQPISNEIFLANAAYGHDLILKAWAGWPATRALKFAMPHGVEYGTLNPSYAPVEHLAVVTYAHDDRVAINRAAGVTARQWPMAMPYAYLLRQLPAEDPPARAGTLFFPAHSTPVLRVTMDWGRLAEAVAGLPERYRPVTACLYFTDILEGMHRPFLDAGVEVASAGHPFDPFFLARLHHLSSVHEHTMSNDIGSALFYAMYSGCRYAPFEHPRPEGWKPNAPVGSTGVALLPVEGQDAVYDERDAILREVAAASGEEQLRFAQHHLGHHHLLEPRLLRRQLRRAEIADRLVVPVLHRGRLPLPLPPAAVRRAVRRLVRRP